MKRFVNLWMALTNLVVLPTLFYSTNPTLTMLAAVAAVASALMHISERKHGLPGFAFANWATVALNLDRACAIIIGTYMFSHFHHRHDLLVVGVIGLMCMAISEFPGVPLRIFVPYHTAWHFCVYYIFYMASTT